MKLIIRGDTVSVGDIPELRADNCQAFRKELIGTLPDNCCNFELDLSRTRFLDNRGLGTLISLRNTAHQRNGKVRLLNPMPSVQLVFDLTCMQQGFEIVRKPAMRSSGPVR